MAIFAIRACVSNFLIPFYIIMQRYAFKAIFVKIVALSNDLVRLSVTLVMLGKSYFKDNL